MSYQQRINSLECDRARYVFEMQNSAKRVIMTMKRWDYNRNDAFECQYENLVEDENGRLFSRVLEHLGFSHLEISKSLDAFIESLLSSKPEGFTSRHVRSGKACQWKEVFDREMGEAFLKHFGDVLTDLGYEKDDSWVLSLSPSTTAITNGCSPETAVVHS